MIEKKHKRGDVREDGMIYWAISHNKPLWLTKEKFDQYCLKRKASTTKLMLNQPEITKKHKRGYVREDGLIFWAIIRKKEIWLTSEKFNQYYLKTKQKNKSLFEKNRDRILLVNKKYRFENREKFNEVCKKWHQRNPEKTRLAREKWAKLHPELKKLHSRKHTALRRTLIRSKQIPDYKHKIISVIYDQAQRLQKRLGIAFHVDHIVPLAKGGEHIPSNLQVLPASLNVRKSASKIYRWSELQLN